MKAIYMDSPKAYDMSLKHTDELEPGPNEVVVKVNAAGICGTDLKIYQGKYPNIKWPIILGHEFSGQVAAVGEGVEGLPVGTNVTARPGISHCGRCRMCIEGKTNVCSEKNRLGFEQNGAFAEYVRVHKDQIHVLPEEIDLTTAAMIEPLAVVVHALRSVTIKPSDTVLVIGPGPIGLIALLLSKANGATVAISGLSKDHKKLSLAQELGADLLIDAEKENGINKLLEMTDGDGSDIVLECTGTAGGVNQGLELCRTGGIYVQIGTWSHPLTVDFMKIAYKELTITGSYGHTKLDWRNSIQLLQTKRIDLTPLIQGIYSMNEWEKAFKDAESGEKAKILIKP